MMRATIIAIVCGLPDVGLAYCEPPFAPKLTTEAIAREFREEFKAEFETYFTDAQQYLRCIDDERQQVMLELKDTASRYERFLNDSRTWGE